MLRKTNAAAKARSVSPKKTPAAPAAKPTASAKRAVAKVSAPSVTAPAPKPGPCRFAALDFETADYSRDSACALSVVVVENQQILHTWTSLIRPPRQSFVFTYIHGISWQDVKTKPTFKDLWSEIAPLLEGVDFIAAHNASFDRSVMSACCAAAAAQTVNKPYICTVKVARALWDLRPTTLADVCRHLRIPLKHHDATSDAQACARILLAANQHGHDYNTLLKNHALKAK